MYSFVDLFFDGIRRKCLPCSLAGREGRQDVVIRVNGTEEACSEEMTVMEYVSAKGYRTNRIAVERNGQIVPKNAYESTVIKDGDSLEVVSFVGGG